MSARMLSGGFVNMASKIAIHAAPSSNPSPNSRMVHPAFVRAVSRLIGLSLLDDFVAQLASAGACFRKMSDQ